MWQPRVIAILCSDLHLSFKPPIWRSEEPIWFEAMAKPLHELNELAYRKHKVPILHAGDLFDKWNSPAELINFALDHLPEMWSIPGQHDLPHHQLKDIQKSAYWTLVKSGKVHNLAPGHTFQIGNEFRVTGFPWGYPLTETEKKNDSLDIALVHEYIWIQGKGYPTAPQEAKVSKAKTKGFDIVSYGDNHQSFEVKGKQGIIWNNGGFMKRHRDEDIHSPRVGLVMSDGSIESHYLNTEGEMYMKMQSADKFTEGPKMDKFFDSLEELGTNDLDFEKTVNEYTKTKKVSKPVVRLIEECMENSDG